MYTNDSEALLEIAESMVKLADSLDRRERDSEKTASYQSSYGTLAGVNATSGQYDPLTEFILRG